MTAPDEVWELSTRRIGRRVLVFDQLDSTNTYTAAHAQDPANDGVVVLARTQTAGRGQYGRTWQSEPGASVLLSVLLFPPPALLRPALLTAWAAVSVCETVQLATGLAASIKWPNDVLLNGRKVCGILIEQGRGTVAGIGLNVNQTAESFAAAALPQAGSLAMFTTSPLDCVGVARQLVKCLDGEYDRLCQGDRSTLEASWKSRLGLLGTRVIVDCIDGHRSGLLRAIGWEGLELEATGGEIVRLRPETVRHLRPAADLGAQVE